MPDDAEAPPSKAVIHAGPDHASPYPVSRLAPAFGLVDTAREIEQADGLLTAVVTAELRVIAEQIRGLQEKAKEVLARAERDAALHRAECRFQKAPGRVYHLYEREDGTRVFSMLSPDDWGARAPGAFLGSYRLEADRSFVEV